MIRRRLLRAAGSVAARAAAAQPAAGKAAGAAADAWGWGAAGQRGWQRLYSAAGGGDPFRTQRRLVDTAEELLKPRPELRSRGWDWHAWQLFVALLPATALMVWAHYAGKTFREDFIVMKSQETEKGAAERREEEDRLRQVSLQANERLLARVEQLERQLAAMQEQQQQQQQQRQGETKDPGTAGTWSWLPWPGRGRRASESGDGPTSPQQGETSSAPDPPESAPAPGTTRDETADGAAGGDGAGGDGSSGSAAKGGLGGSWGHWLWPTPSPSGEKGAAEIAGNSQRAP